MSLGRGAKVSQGHGARMWHHRGRPAQGGFKQEQPGPARGGTEAGQTVAGILGRCRPHRPAARATSVTAGDLVAIVRKLQRRRSKTAEGRDRVSSGRGSPLAPPSRSEHPRAQRAGDRTAAGSGTGRPLTGRPDVRSSDPAAVADGRAEGESAGRPRQRLPAGGGARGRDFGIPPRRGDQGRGGPGPAGTLRSGDTRVTETGRPRAAELPGTAAKPAAQTERRRLSAVTLTRDRGTVRPRPPRRDPATGRPGDSPSCPGRSRAAGVRGFGGSSGGRAGDRRAVTGRGARSAAETREPGGTDGFSPRVR